MNPHLLLEPGTLDDDELFSILCGDVVPPEVARDLKGGLHVEGALARGWPEPLLARLLAGREVWRRHAERAELPRPILDHGEAVARFARARLGEPEVEVFLVVLLDVRLRPITSIEVSRGTLTSSLVHPREVFRAAVLGGAASIAVVHNHPSGDPEPSSEDELVTERLDRAGQVLGIPLLDHVILGRTRSVSLAARGLVKGAARAPTDLRAASEQDPKIAWSRIDSKGASPVDARENLSRDRSERRRVRKSRPSETPPPLNYHFATTQSGAFALVFVGDRLSALLFPEVLAQDLRAELARRFPFATEAPLPPGLTSTLEVLRRYVETGEGDPAACPVDFADDRVPEFHREIYAQLRQVPRGNTVSYGELARRAGRPLAARAVGQAMRRNPWPLLVPCHRVLASDGGLGGFSAPGGVSSKQRLLQREGAFVTE